MARHAARKHAKNGKAGPADSQAATVISPALDALSGSGHRPAPRSRPPGGRGGLARWTAGLRQPAAIQFARHWLAIFVLSLALFVLRFLVPSPVGMADNGDGPRLMCAFGVAPVTGRYPRYDSYAYFTFDPSRSCAGASTYSSSQHLLLALARWLTPILGLPGTLNLIALGLIICAIQSAGIASLACGLRVGLAGRLAVGAAAWLIMADAAFFGTYASPLSEGATLTGLLLVAAGVLYLGRKGPSFLLGLLLSGTGAYLAIMSKEQYILLAAPICLMLVLASAARNGRHGIARYLTARTAAAGALAGLLAVSVLAYEHQNDASAYIQNGHQQQVVDVIFNGILVVDRHNGASDLRELGLPASWTTYAGTGYWSPGSVVYNRLYPKYVAKLNDTNLLRFEFTHPLTTIEIGQQAADQAMAFRIPYLGSYSPAAGYSPGALEDRVGLVSSLVEAVPSGLGLFWLVSLWLVLALIGLLGVRPGATSQPWQRDCGFAVLLLVGCALAAFVPAAFLDAEETTRHMLGSNLATALGFALSITILAGKLRQGIATGNKDQSSGGEAPSTPPSQHAPALAADSLVLAGTARGVHRIR
jgi:hypothetical protein